MSQETTKNRAVKARISQKHDFECNWLKAVNFKPQVAELIVYDPEVDSEGNVLDGLSVNERGREPYSFSRLKIGDGIRLVTDLPFCEADVTKEYVDDAVEELSSSIDLVEEKAEQAESIAKGKNQAKVFDTEQEMLDTVKRWYCIYPGRTLPAGSTIIMSTGGSLEDDTEGKAIYNYYTSLSINDEEIYRYLGGFSPVSIGDRLVCTYALNRDITIEKIEYNIYAYGYIDEFDEEGNWVDATYHEASFSGPSRLSYSTDSYQYGDTTVPTSLIKPLDISVGDNLYIRELDKPDYWWDGSQAQQLETQKVDLTTVPGQKVEDGGEIFNDYENNKALSEFSHAEGNQTVAGSKAFKIREMHTFGDSSEGRFLLESVEGLAAGMKYTAVLTNNFDFVGVINNISEVDAEYGPHITVSGIPSGSGLTIKDTSYLLIPDRPDLGDIIIGEYAHAEGTETTAQAKAAHAEGNKTNAAGKYAHAEGHSTVAAYAAHAEGHTTEATAEASHSEGKKSKATNLAAHAEGSGTSATAEAAHSEGRSTQAKNTSAHAEGEGTIASGFAAHSEGQSTDASGDQSHAEGYDNDATGTAAHAEGAENLSEGYAAHVEGHKNQAKGDMSHAGGFESIADARGAFVHGSNLIAEHNDQTVFGQFNDSGAYEDLFIIGNGEDNEHRANAFVVHRDGTATIQHGPINSNDVADKEYVDGAVDGAKSFAQGVVNNYESEVNAKFASVDTDLATVRKTIADNATFSENTYVRKVTPSSGKRVYTVEANSDGSSSQGSKPFNHSYYSESWSLVQRDGNGKILAKDPDNEYDVTNKRYVDNADAVLDNKITEANEKIDNATAYAYNRAEEAYSAANSAFGYAGYVDGELSQFKSEFDVFANNFDAFANKFDGDDYTESPITEEIYVPRKGELGLEDIGNDTLHNVMSSIHDQLFELNENAYIAELANDVANKALDIAKGKNQARVFETENDMREWVQNDASYEIDLVGKTLPAGTTIIYSADDNSNGHSIEGAALIKFLTINGTDIFQYDIDDVFCKKDRVFFTYVLREETTIDSIDAFIEYHSSGDSASCYENTRWSYIEGAVDVNNIDYNLIKPHNLFVGDNLYIRELTVPDYWWDGSQPQQLETQKVDLTGYVKTEELDPINEEIDSVSDIATTAQNTAVEAKEIAHTAMSIAQETNQFACVDVELESVSIENYFYCNRWNGNTLIHEATPESTSEITVNSYAHLKLSISYDKDADIEATTIPTIKVNGQTIYQSTEAKGSVDYEGFIDTIELTFNKCASVTFDKFTISAVGVHNADADSHKDIRESIDYVQYRYINERQIQIGETIFTEDDLKKILRFIKTFDFGGNE